MVFATKRSFKLVPGNRLMEESDINGVFTGNNGTLNWLINWTETGDDGVATTGDIRIATNRIEFRDTVGTVLANESIRRSATTGISRFTSAKPWPRSAARPMSSG